MQKISILFVLFILVFSSLFAEEKKEKKDAFKTADSQFGEVIEVVGSIPLLKTIQTVSLADRSYFNAIDATNLKEAIALTPGLFTLSTGQSGQVSSTFIRGSKSTQILYIIDGIKIRDFVNIGGMNLSVISPSMMNRVEIVRGPLSNIYGSDAQGGVININTDSKKGIFFSGAYGSHGSYTGDFSFAKTIGDGLDLSFNVNTRRNSNDIPNDVFRNSGISAKLAYAKEKLRIGLNYFGNLTDSGVPYTWDLKSSLDTEYKQNYHVLAVPVRIDLSDKSKLKLIASYTRSNYKFEDPDAFFNFQSRLVSNTMSFESEFSTRLNRYINLRSGIEYAGFNATNETDDNLLIDDHSANSFSAYLHGDISYKNLMIFLSARYDKYKDVDSHISPQVGFSYLIAERLKIRGSYSNSFKTPMITHQINPWGIENFSLKPELADSFEVGVDYYSKYITLGITYFNTAYKDMIDWVTVDMTTFAGQYQNISNVDIKGTEFLLTVRPSDAVTLQATYTYLDSKDKSSGDALLRRPKHSFTGLIIYRHRFFRTSLQMVHVGERSDSDPLSWPPLTTSPSFNHFNFNIYVPITEGLAVTGKISNLFDTEYSEIFGYPSPKRRFELGFRYQIAD